MNRLTPSAASEPAAALTLAAAWILARPSRIMICPNVDQTAFETIATRLRTPMARVICQVSANQEGNEFMSATTSPPTTKLMAKATANPVESKPLRFSWADCRICWAKTIVTAETASMPPIPITAVASAKTP